MRRPLVALALLLLAPACADQTSVSVDAAPATAPGRTCPSFTQADVDAARTALSEVSYGGGEKEPLALLASSMSVGGAWVGVILRRRDGMTVHSVREGYPVTGHALNVLVQPGDVFQANLVYDDQEVDDVMLLRKGAFAVAPGACP